MIFNVVCLALIVLASLGLAVNADSLPFLVTYIGASILYSGLLWHYAVY